MIIWLDAQLPPALAAWITATFTIPAQAVRDLGLATAKDAEIFQAARLAKAVVMTKDADFAELVGRLGSPPHVLWVTCGNTTNARLRQILSVCMPAVIAKLQAGERLIEITDLP
jgi:predicted nuclease of predicted toxin-antitoxin system